MSLEQDPENADRRNTTLFVLLFVIPLVTTIAYGGTDTWALVLLAPFYLLLGGVWIVRSWRRGGIEIDRNAVLLPMCGLLLLGILQILPVGIVPAGAEHLSVPASSALSLDPFATQIFLIRLFGYIIFFAAALTFIDTPGRLRKTVAAIIVIGGVLAFVGILQKLASPDAIYGLRKPTQAIPFGPYVNQHHFASLMVLLSGLAVAHLIGNGVARQSKLLIGISAVLMGVAVPLTSSRGGIISYLAMLAVAGLAWFFRHDGRSEKNGRLAAAAGAALGFVIIVGTVIFLGGADSLLRGIGFTNTSDDVSSGRLHFWSVAWDIFTANPLIGAGFDAFAVAFTRYDTGNGMFRVEQAHNEYLQMLADGGIVAFLLVIAFIVLLAKRGYGRIRHSTDAFQRMSAIGALAGCAGIFVHSFFDFPLRTAGNAYFFFLVAAVAVMNVPAGSEETIERGR